MTRKLIRNPGGCLKPESRIYWETEDRMYYAIHWPTETSVWRDWPDTPEKVGSYPTLEAAAASIEATVAEH